MALFILLYIQHAEKIPENKYHSKKYTVEKPKTVLSTCKWWLLLKTQKSS